MWDTAEIGLDSLAGNAKLAMRWPFWRTRICLARMKSDCGLEPYAVWFG